MRNHRFARIAATLLLAGLIPMAPLLAAPSPGGAPAGTFNANISGSVGAATYSVTIAGLAPAAAATDFLTIQGSATKVIRVVEARCTGLSTAAATQEIKGIKRSALNTGTSGRTTLTAVPHDSTDAAATAVAYSYTTNPTTLGAAVGTVRDDLLTTNTAATSAFANGWMVWNFRAGTDPVQGVTLRGNQIFALNGAAGTYSTGTTLNCSLTWTESTL